MIWDIWPETKEIPGVIKGFCCVSPLADYLLSGWRMRNLSHNQFDSALEKIVWQAADKRAAIVNEITK